MSTEIGAFWTPGWGLEFFEVLEKLPGGILLISMHAQMAVPAKPKLTCLQKDRKIDHLANSC